MIRRAPREARGVVRRLLRQPAGVGKRVAETALEKGVGREIGLGHRRTAGLRLDRGRGLAARTEKGERRLAGLARGGDEEIARGERVPIGSRLKGRGPALVMGRLRL